MNTMMLSPRRFRITVHNCIDEAFAVLCSIKVVTSGHGAVEKAMRGFLDRRGQKDAATQIPFEYFKGAWLVLIVCVIQRATVHCAILVVLYLICTRDGWNHETSSFHVNG